MFKIHTVPWDEFFLIPFKGMYAQEHSKVLFSLPAEQGELAPLKAVLWQALCQGLEVDEWEMRNLPLWAFWQMGFEYPPKVNI